MFKSYKVLKFTPEIQNSKRNKQDNEIDISTITKSLIKKAEKINIKKTK